MNVYYAKCVLYAYPHIESIIAQLDDIVEKKAISSMGDFSPCIEICEKIVGYTKQKDLFIKLKILCERALSKFTKYEKDCFDYKYFKKNSSEYYVGFDSDSRTYFRRQIKLAKKFATQLNEVGVTDEWFEKECMSIRFFKETFRRVIEYEKICQNSNPNNKKKQDVFPNRKFIKKTLSA